MNLIEYYQTDIFSYLVENKLDCGNTEYVIQVSQESDCTASCVTIYIVVLLLLTASRLKK